MSYIYSTLILSPDESNSSVFLKKDIYCIVLIKIDCINFKFQLLYIELSETPRPFVFLPSLLLASCGVVSYKNYGVDIQLAVTPECLHYSFTRVMALSCQDRYPCSHGNAPARCSLVAFPLGFIDAEARVLASKTATLEGRNSIRLLYFQLISANRDKGLGRDSLTISMYVHSFKGAHKEDDMSGSVFSSELFKNMFGTAEMRGVFEDKALVRRYLEIEAALARAEAQVGLIPVEAAEKISEVAAGLTVDMERMRIETENVGYPILPVVHQLAEASGDVGGYVHWGATTQDIMDTATAMQMRDALVVVKRDLLGLRDILADLARKHRDTPMAGRTHLQQALPTTFGNKAAVWLSSIERHIERVDQAVPRIVMGQFSGAAGTLASLGDDGLEVQRLFCKELGLDQPPICWHVARDGLAEAATLLGLITGTLGKIATDVMIMASVEFGEVSEPFVPGRGASSTMPQKRNPISSELMLAAAKLVRQQVAAMLDAMIHDFERATGPWHVEWAALPEAFLLTGAGLSQAKFMLGGLNVHEDRMRDNLDLTHGLIVAEAVMMAAAPRLGRQTAHDIVYQACSRALAEKRTLVDVLQDDSAVTDALGGPEAVASLCNPAGYLGLSGQMVDRMLDSQH